jgi:hypothetical protein
MSTITRTPVPLVPSPQLTRENALRSFVRGCVLVARQTRDRSIWSDDHAIDLVLRAPVTPTTTQSAATLATIKIALIAALVPTSAAARVIAQSLKLEWDGAYQINIPGLTIPRANWVSEDHAVPVEQGLSSAGAVVDPYKLATIIPLTNEILNSSNIEPIMRQMLIESIGPALDAALLSNAAGVPGLSPPGILHGVAPIAASASTGLAGMAADLAAIATAIAPASGSGTPLLIAAAPQAVSLALLAPREVWPVVMSAALPAGTVIGLVPEGLATILGLPRLDLAKHTTLHMDDTPNDLLSGSTPVRSVFQTDSQALRLIQDATWALRSPSALAWVQGTKW